MLKKFGCMNVCRGTGRSVFSFYFEPCSWPFPLSIQSLPTFNFVCFYSSESLCFTNPFLYTALLTAMTAHATTQLHIHLPLVSLNNKTRKTTIHMVQRHFRTALTLCTLSSSNNHVPCQCGGWQERVEVYFYVWSYSFVSKSTEQSIKKQLNE